MLNYWLSFYVQGYLAVQMRDYEREVFVVLLLDTRHQLLEFRELFQGTIDAATVHPRAVVRIALPKNAAAVLVAHNHPSGNAEPSQSDIALTGQLRAALQLLDIRVIAQFIVGRWEVTSLASRGPL